MAAEGEFNRSKEDMNSFRNWLLKEIMPHTIGDEKQQKKMLSVEGMRILDRAFTSKTMVYDITKNYEQYETLGDSLLAYLLEELVLEKFPYADSGEISNMKGEYGSNKYQSLIMHKIGASRFLLRAPNTDLTRYGILGDVFESLFYAIFLVVKREFPNLAYNACYNLFHYFYDNRNFVQLDFIYSRGDAKTIITTKMFNRLRDASKSTYMSHIKEEKTLGSVAILKVTVDLPSMVLLRQYGIDISRPIVVEAKESSLDVASNTAYTKLLKELESRGITEKKIEEIKSNEDISDEEIAPTHRGAMTVAVSKGYNKLSFEVDQKLSKSIGEDAKVMLLLGTRRSGSTDVLLCAIGSQNTKQTKIKLLEAYQKNTPFQMLDFRRK